MKVIFEMVIFIGGVVIFVKNNVNGFFFFVFVWFEGFEDVIGCWDFFGFYVYMIDGLCNQVVLDMCKMVFSVKVFCDNWVYIFLELVYRGILGNMILIDFVCDKGCGELFKSWFDNVSFVCEDYDIVGDILIFYGG